MDLVEDFTLLFQSLPPILCGPLPCTYMVAFTPISLGRGEKPFEFTVQKSDIEIKATHHFSMDLSDIKQSDMMVKQLSNEFASLLESEDFKKGYELCLTSTYKHWILEKCDRFSQPFS